MKKNLFILLLLLFAAPLFSQVGGIQGVADVEFVNQVADRPVATFGDAVTLFSMLYSERKTNFAGNLSMLQGKGLLGDTGLAETDGLRRGTLALMAARYLDLGDSLLYAIIGTGRYAVKACVANEIMDFSGGEWDILSGGELVEVVRKVAEKAGGSK